MKPQTNTQAINQQSNPAQLKKHQRKPTNPNQPTQAAIHITKAKPTKRPNIAQHLTQNKAHEPGKQAQVSAQSTNPRNQSKLYPIKTAQKAQNQ